MDMGFLHHAAGGSYWLVFLSFCKQRIRKEPFLMPTRPLMKILLFIFYYYFFFSVHINFGIFFISFFLKIINLVDLNKVMKWNGDMSKIVDTLL